ncbi:MAG: MBG domain-containing protein, partial [Verrucomicrobia bacterium]|nr:MBG domain-containing protein [Verrucomicrobiota bacterium]
MKWNLTKSLVTSLALASLAFGLPGAALAQRAVRVVNVSGVPGGQVNVAVELDAQGNENTAAFSLGFDPSKLVYVSSTTGAALVSGSSFLVNDSSAATGVLGVLLGLPVNQAFAAGPNRQLAVFTFLVNGAVVGPADVAINFTDTPVSREVVSVGADVLSAAFVNGNVKVIGTATVTLGNLSPTYDGTAKSATATTVPGGLAVTFTYDGNPAAPVNAGSYAVVATVNDPNYQGSANGTLAIGKATPTATLAVNNSPVTYDATAKSATVVISASSVSGAVANILTGGTATKTNVGTYAVTADFVPTDTANYNSLLAQAAGNFVISKATP